MVGPTRRAVLGLLSLGAVRLPGQDHGMASRNVKPPPRGKPAGLPFHARFTDVSRSAGLNRITVCGHPGRNDYIIESMGCGAAFFDYDNDGWLDIFILCGSRYGDPPRPPTASTKTIAMAPSPTSPKRPAYFVPVTPMASPSATSTTTASKICSSPAGARTSSTATTAMAPSPTSRKRPAFSIASPRVRCTGCTFLDYDRDGKLDLFVLQLPRLR